MLNIGNVITALTTVFVAIYAIVIAFRLTTGDWPDPQNIPQFFTTGISGFFCRLISGIFFLLLFSFASMAIAGLYVPWWVYAIVIAVGFILGVTYLIFRGIAALVRFIWNHVPGANWMKWMVTIGIAIIILAYVVFMIILV